MIDNLQFTSGYPMDIPQIGNRLIKFAPGINILFGSNGCGKSTILNTLKSYCGIAKGGWSFINDPMQLAAEYFPFGYVGLTPSRCTANVAWDGTPTFYNDGDIKVNDTFFYMQNKSCEDGITSGAEQLDLLAEKPSSGQYRIKQFNKVLNMIRDIPIINSSHTPNGYNMKSVECELAYWASLSHTGPQTILLDEPERALNLLLQKKVFTEILPKFKDLQIIIATHSIFCLDMEDVNFIEFDDNYVEDCKKLLKP